mmetsp:Transcript_8214/g.17809  ORF Transcript_8214/g.17809 Transcript_8214/m.17809 type:complete len:240 (+) Transcript_8214:562-1281(+)
MEGAAASPTKDTPPPRVSAMHVSALVPTLTAGLASSITAILSAISAAKSSERRRRPGSASKRLPQGVGSDWVSRSSWPELSPKSATSMKVRRTLHSYCNGPMGTGSGNGGLEEHRVDLEEHRVDPGERDRAGLETSWRKKRRQISLAAANSCRIALRPLAPLTSRSSSPGWSRLNPSSCCFLFQQPAAESAVMLARTSRGLPSGTPAPRCAEAASFHVKPQGSRPCRWSATSNPPVALS